MAYRYLGSWSWYTTLGTPVSPQLTRAGTQGPSRVSGMAVGLNKETSTGPNDVSMRIMRLTGLRTDVNRYSTSLIPVTL